MRISKLKPTVRYAISKATFRGRFRLPAYVSWGGMRGGRRSMRRCTLQHRLNSVHLYCRMCSFMPRRVAIIVARMYERVVHPILYR